MSRTTTTTAVERKQVVLVDDDRDLQTIVRGWLSDSYDTVSLSSGEGLLDELASLEPSLLILDVVMPGPDGFTLCRKIRSDSRFADLPILFLTGCGADDDFIRNIDAGGTAYLVKPVSRRRLLVKVAELTAGQ
jgi:DNA-binding response OmpR family regulator